MKKSIKSLRTACAAGTFLAAALFAVSAVMGAVIHVPGDQPNIQAGIDAAQDGDTVLVADGTYTGPGNVNLDPGGKAILVASENGAETCIIDCQGSGRGFYFHSGEDTASIVRGFTIREGHANKGGGVFCSGASPLIEYCVIRNCIADYSGGGIALTSSSAVIRNCVVNRNQALDDLSASGGGIYTSGGRPLITGCIIQNNTIFDTSYAAGGGICCANADITNCVIAHNTADSELVGGGGGISAFGDNVRIENCLLFDNYAALYAGGIDIEHASVTLKNCTFTDNCSEYTSGGAINTIQSTVTITNCILWDDDPSEIQVDEGYSTVTVSYSDIDGGFTGTGNIDSDPLFVAGVLGPYYLSQTDAGQASDSPCIDAGNNLASAVCVKVYGGELCMDAMTTRTDEVEDAGTVDMGYHYLPTSSVPTVTPTPTPSPLPTNTPVPSYTPTPTPAGSGLTVSLQMPSHDFHPGDTCGLQIEITNNTSESADVMLVVLLDLGTGTTWFYPGWKAYPPDFDYAEMTLAPGVDTMDIIDTFQWPDTGADSFSDAHFMAALLTPDFSELASNLDDWSFGWGPGD